MLIMFLDAGKITEFIKEKRERRLVDCTNHLVFCVNTITRVRSEPQMHSAYIKKFGLNRSQRDEDKKKKTKTELQLIEGKRSL